MNADAHPITVVICETRTTDLVGMKLFLASLRRESPDVAVRAYLPPPLLDASRTALAAIHPGALLLAYAGPASWDCKPTVLLDAIESLPGGSRVIWVDNDMIVVGELNQLANESAHTVIVAQETNPNSNGSVARRQTELKLPATGPAATTIASSVIGVTREHVPLLRRWQQEMAGELFLREQSLPRREREFFPTDQEVWEAVLCAAVAQDASLSLRWLANGRELIQGNYTAFEPPPLPSAEVGGDYPLLIHATGDLKPWRVVRHRLTQELFPYFRAARRYRSVLSDDEAIPFRRRSLVAWFWQHFGGGFTTYRGLRRAINRRRRAR